MQSRTLADTDPKLWCCSYSGSFQAQWGLRGDLEVKNKLTPVLNRHQLHCLKLCLFSYYHYCLYFSHFKCLAYTRFVLQHACAGMIMMVFSGVTVQNEQCKGSCACT